MTVPLSVALPLQTYSMSSNILYCTISRRDEIIADAPTSARRQYRESLRGVLRLGYVFEKERRSVKFAGASPEAEEILMHHLRVDDVVFVCLAPASCRLRVAHSFLEEVQAEFLAAQGPAASLLRADKSFDASLRRIYDYYTDPSNDRAVAARQQLENVQSLAIETVAELLERGEKVSALVERASELDSSSQHFKRTAQTVVVKQRCANWRMQCAITVVVTVVLVVALVATAVVVLWRMNKLNDVIAWIKKTL